MGDNGNGGSGGGAGNRTGGGGVGGHDSVGDDGGGGGGGCDGGNSFPTLTYRRSAFWYNFTFSSSGMVVSLRMRDMSRLSDVFATTGADLCIALYSLSVCS